MAPQSRMKHLANIGIAAAETFLVAKDPKLKYGAQNIQKGSCLRERSSIWSHWGWVNMKAN